MQSPEPPPEVDWTLDSAQPATRHVHPSSWDSSSDIPTQFYGRISAMGSTHSELHGVVEEFISLSSANGWDMGNVRIVESQTILSNILCLLVYIHQHRRDKAPGFTDAIRKLSITMITDHVSTPGQWSQHFPRSFLSEFPPLPGWLATSLTTMKNLTHLTISTNGSFTAIQQDKFCRSLRYAETLRDLRYLKIAGVAEPTGTAIMKIAPNIQSLDISSAVDISSAKELLKAAAIAIPGLKRLSFPLKFPLEEDMFDEYRRISDEYDKLLRGKRGTLFRKLECIIISKCVPANMVTGALPWEVDRLMGFTSRIPWVRFLKMVKGMPRLNQMSFSLPTNTWDTTRFVMHTAADCSRALDLFVGELGTLQNLDRICVIGNGGHALEMTKEKGSNSWNKKAYMSFGEEDWPVGLGSNG